MAGIPECLVFHRRDSPLIARSHRRQAAGRVKGLEHANGCVELNALTFRQRRHLRAPAIAQHPRERRVVVQHAFQRIDDLVLEWTFWCLRETANTNLDARHGVESRNPQLRQDVHHPRCKPAVRYHTHATCFRARAKRFLFIHDFRIAAEVGKMHAGVDGEPRHLEIEVVGERAHHRACAGHFGARRGMIAHVQCDHLQPRRPDPPREERRKCAGGVAIGEHDFADRGILQQVIRTG